MSSINTWKFLAGLGLFLYGLDLMGEVSKKIAGRSFKLFLRRHTNNRTKSIIGGAVITGFIQSSSVIILMLMSFVNAGIISFRNAFGVLIGSNLGTTVDSWFIATVGFSFDLQSYSLPIIAVTALVMFFSARRKQLYNSLYFLFSIGILLLGFGFMKDGADQLVVKFNIAAYTDYNLFIIFLIGFLLTVIIQSSSVTMAIALTALHAHALTFPAAAAVVIGSEIGTTIKILVSSIKAERESRMLAWADFFFNVFTVIISFSFLSQIIYFIQYILGIHNPLIGLVFFQSFINLASILLFLPFINPFSRLLEKLFSKNNDKVDVSAGLQATHDPATTVMQKAADDILQRVIGFHRKIFNSVSPDSTTGFMPALRSFTRIYGTTDREYALLKQTEGDYLKYYSGLQEEIPGKDEHKKLNNYLSSILQSIHAAKSVHDIDHNLKMFLSSANNYLFREHTTVREDWELFDSTYNQLSGIKNAADMQKQLVNLKTISIARFEMHKKETEGALFRHEIVQMEASTLLNVYLEMLSSKKALLRAFALLKLNDNGNEIPFDDTSHFPL